MITLVWYSDIHLSDRTFRQRTDNWTETGLGKLKQIGEIATEVEAHGIIGGGDLFDIRSPTRVSHTLVRAVADVIQSWPCPNWSTVGNHDCKYGDYHYLPEQPLGVLFSTGVIRRLYDEHEAQFYGHGSRLHIPEDQWPRKQGPVIGEQMPAFHVRVVGIPYHGNEYEQDRLTDLHKHDETYLATGGHLLASKKGGQMFEGEDILKYKELAKLPPDLWMFGHWHKNQGVEDIGNGKQAINIGSLCRGALAQDNWDRKPSVAVIRFYDDGIEVEVRPLQFQDAKEIFNVEGRVREEARSTMMDEFVHSVQATLASQRESDLRDDVRAMPAVLDEVKERAILYLERAGATS